MGTRPWAIGSRLHWLRDVTFGEDRSQAFPGQAPRVMVSGRKTVINLLRLNGWNNIAKALLDHGRDPQRLLNLLRTS